MIKKEIAQQLKQDIYTLVNIARSHAPDDDVQDAITVAENCIHAGLTDYELAFTEAYALGLEQGRGERLGEQDIIEGIRRHQRG